MGIFRSLQTTDRPKPPGPVHCGGYIKLAGSSQIVDVSRSCQLRFIFRLPLPCYFTKILYTLPSGQSIGDDICQYLSQAAPPFSVINEFKASSRIGADHNRRLHYRRLEAS